MLKAKMGPTILPSLQRLFVDGELRPDGVRSGVFVEIGLVADLPFMRHACGLRSQNADCFGMPFCPCKDKQLYEFAQFCPRTHHGQVSFEHMCHLSHTPLWLALGLPEPERWTMKCPKEGCPLHRKVRVIIFEFTTIAYQYILSSLPYHINPNR